MRADFRPWCGYAALMVEEERQGEGLEVETYSVEEAAKVLGRTPGASGRCSGPGSSPTSDAAEKGSLEASSPELESVGAGHWVAREIPDGGRGAARGALPLDYDGVGCALSEPAGRILSTLRRVAP
jgi:hypothetical protein